MKEMSEPSGVLAVTRNGSVSGTAWAIMAVPSAAVVASPRNSFALEYSDTVAPCIGWPLRSAVIHTCVSFLPARAVMPMSLTHTRREAALSEP